MNMVLRSARLLLALAAAVLPAHAQDPFTATLKLRAGEYSGPVSSKSLGHQTKGLGVEFAFPKGDGQLFVEATYDLFNGYRRDVTELGGSAWYAGDATQDPFNPSAPSQTWQGHTLTTEPSTSLFAEMLEYQGFGLRCGWRAPIKAGWMDGWDWHAGLSLDRRETRHEVQMTLTPGYYDAANGNQFTLIPPDVTRLDTSYYEGARFTKTTYSMLFGAFAGISHSFNEIFRTELTARYTTFKTPHYQPFTYTGQVPSISSSTKGGLVLEVAIGITL